MIAGCQQAVIASVDTDGTDGPGGLGIPGTPACLAGGIVDGYTVEEAGAQGVDIAKALREHDVSRVLWWTNCAVTAEQNISLNELTVILIDRE